MPLTAALVQARILERTGDFDPTTGDPVVGGGGYLEQQMAGVWAEYADKAYVGPRLLELYVERDLFKRYLAALQHKFDFRDSDAEFKRSQRIETLKARRDEVIAKINETLAMLAANRSPSVALITATAPVSPLPLGVDAGSPRYGGSPYFRQPWNYP